jgi:hypothetical protein
LITLLACASKKRVGVRIAPLLLTLHFFLWLFTLEILLVANFIYQQTLLDDRAAIAFAWPASLYDLALEKVTLGRSTLVS